MYAQFWWAWAISAAAAYLLGSVNGSITLSKLIHHADIRSFGSGNAGMTNTLRTYGGKMALAVSVIDALKAVAAVLLGRWLIGDPAVLVAGAAVILGHTFPLFFGFHGGKGVICGAIVILMMDARVFGCIILLFVVVAALSRMISAASIACALAFPILTWAFLPGQTAYIWFAAVAGLFVIVLHRKNIGRILKGTESRFYGNKGKEGTRK